MSHIDTQHSGCSSGYIDSTGEISIYLYSIEQQRHEKMCIRDSFMISLESGASW